MQVFSLDETKQPHLPDLPMPIKEFQTLKTDQFVFCMGGFCQNAASNKVWKVNVKEKNKKWEEDAFLNQCRYSLGAADFHRILVVADETDARLTLHRISSVVVFWKHLTNGE